VNLDNAPPEDQTKAMFISRCWGCGRTEILDEASPVEVASQAEVSGLLVTPEATSHRRLPNEADDAERIL
jgi:hypothetical protein